MLVNKSRRAALACTLGGVIILASSACSSQQSVAPTPSPSATPAFCANFLEYEVLFLHHGAKATAGRGAQPGDLPTIRQELVSAFAQVQASVPAGAPAVVPNVLQKMKVALTQDNVPKKQQASEAEQREFALWLTQTCPGLDSQIQARAEADGSVTVPKR